MKKNRYRNLALFFLCIGIAAAGMSKNIPGTTRAMETTMIVSFVGMLTFWIAWLVTTKDARATAKTAKRVARNEERKAQACGIEDKKSTTGAVRRGERPAKLRKLAKISLAAMLLSSLASRNFDKGSIGYEACFVALMLFFYLTLGFFFAALAVENKERTPEQLQADEEAHQKAMERSREMQIADKTPVAATLVAIDSRFKKPIRAYGHAMIAHSLLGIFGAFWALEDAETKDFATFSVRYASGRTKKETVAVDSARFQHLLELCD